MAVGKRANAWFCRNVIHRALIMTNQIPSLSYGMPNCPSCEKQGLVLTDKDHVACIHCDYKRDFSVSLKKPRKKNPDAEWFVFFLIFGFFLFVLLSNGG